MLLMGIDLGTSSLKVVVMDENGCIVVQRGKQYDTLMPSPGFAEQNPTHWWEVCCDVIKQCLSEGAVSAADVAAISFSGQMHGAVVLDADHRVLCNAIIHCDGRSARQASNIEDIVGRDYIVNNLLNPIFPGFQLPTLMWIKDNDFDIFSQIKTVLCPKDYLRLKLTGEVCGEYSDASATLAFDIPNRRIDSDLLERLELPVSIFPACVDSTAVAGHITSEAARATGLRAGTPVVAGGSDQVMQAIGNGVVTPGDATATIGTGGQVLFPTSEPIINPRLNTHTFCGSGQQSWYTMGALLAGGVCLSWLKDSILNNSLSFSDVDKMAEKAALGCGGLIFLPYLRGERTPHLNIKARGMFFGLSLDKTKDTMARAVMEGVTFAMKDCLDTCADLGLRPKRVIASGGAARSKFWLQMQSDIYGLPLHTNKVVEHAAVGAAITAGVGVGVYADTSEGCRAAVVPDDGIVEPDMSKHTLYLECYELFKNLYSSNIENFESLRV